MVNFIMISDSDKKRRQSYINAIMPLLPAVDKLTVSKCSFGDFSAAWAAGVWAPVDHVVDGEGAAIIFGDAIGGPGHQRMSAEKLRRSWSDSRLPEAFDGFHVAITFDSKRGLCVGADLLGLFPVYYYASEEAILVGSSPELFKHHPCFQMKLSTRGLVGILLTGGLFEGQTLLCGVKRLTPGHLLECHPEKPTREILQFKLPISNRHFDLKLSEQVEILDQALDEAVARHVLENEQHCMLLSGGLDSRLIGGYLRQRNRNIVALTEGLPTDDDTKCAKLVTHTLGFKHTQFKVDDNEYLRFAEMATNWQHLSNGFTGIMFWGFYPTLRKISKRVITGFMGDGIFGTLVDWARPKPEEPPNFKTFFRNLNGSAFRPAILRKLLKVEDCDRLISETLQRIETIYKSYSELEFQRVWGFGLHNRLRFHDASGIWSLTFGSWPVLPFVDRKILEIIGGMPIEALTNRLLERELLCRKHPKLASLPLSGTTHDTTPLMPTTRHKIVKYIFGSAGIWRLKGTSAMRNALLIKLRGERRYWSRNSYFGSSGWTVIRRAMEPYLEQDSSLLYKNAVKNLMPPSGAGDARVKLQMAREGLIEASSLKILLGLAYWLQKHHEALDGLNSSK